MLFCSDRSPSNHILEGIYFPSHVDWRVLGVILGEPTIAKTIRSPLTYARKSSPAKLLENALGYHVNAENERGREGVGGVSLHFDVR